MRESRDLGVRVTKQASRLIKAAQATNLERYSKKPEGVWGSTATIVCGDVTIKSTELDFEFNIPFDDNLESNEGEIIVYNLSNNTLKRLTAKSKITITAGYNQGYRNVIDTGVIFNGYITKVSTKREDTDRVTTIKVIDDIGEKESLELSFTKGITAQEILKALLEKTGLPIKVFAPKRDWTYDNDVSIDEPLESAIKTYSEVCGVSTFTSLGQIYCGDITQFDDRTMIFDVKEDTGMIGSPTFFEDTVTVDGYEDTIEGYEIEMLLQHRLRAGSYIYLSCEEFKGKCWVVSGEHSFSESSCTT